MSQRITAFDHYEIYAGNARQAAHFYRTAMGFRLAAYKGLETGSRDKVSYILEQGKVRLVVSSPLHEDSSIHEHLRRHGDGVKDVAFTVSDAEAAWKEALARGAEPAAEPSTLEDEHGKVKLASIRTYGDTVHTFVERHGYKGSFLPGYQPWAPGGAEPPSAGLLHVDHIVGNVPEGDMEDVASWYEKTLGFHRFWSVDDKDVSTEFSALRSIVVASENEAIKLPINEPAAGKRKSQIQEYLDYYHGPGVQHIALSTSDIIRTVSEMRERGVEFLYVPSSYYEGLRERMGPIDEDMEALARLGILVDRDEHGYMLQIFTKPVQDRPTLFYEVIQRKGGRGFGKGNFKALFESIEREQEKRGNL
jgi:4-hydroxyphenylpyruvate dioxygenase